MSALRQFQLLILDSTIEHCNVSFQEITNIAQSGGSAEDEEEEDNDDVEEEEELKRPAQKVLHLTEQ